MFQFRRFPAYAYLIQRTLTEYCSAGFPHSVISGSTVICTSPELIAACHDLLRLLMPRHSPCALISLTFVGGKSAHSVSAACLRLPAKSFIRSLPPPLLAKPASLGFGSGKGFLQAFGSLRVIELCRRQSFDKIIALPFFSKSSTIYVCFPLLLALHTFGFFVQFSRCGSGLKPDSSTQLPLNA